MALQQQQHLQQQQQQTQQPPSSSMPQPQQSPPPPGSPPAPPLSPPPPPPPTELPPLSPTYIPGSPSSGFNSWSSPLSPTLYPSASPPGPPSPSILPARPTYSFDLNPSPHSPRSNGYDVDMNGENAGATAGYSGDEEEEEDEAFPVPFAAAAEKGFNSEETSKAFSTFFGDGSSEDEDEPLPTKKDEQRQPVLKVEEPLDHSPPPSLPPQTDSLVQLRLNDDEDMEETEEDEPLPSSGSGKSFPPTAEIGSDEPAAVVPLSPPPAPPMSPPPPPPPPLESPPPIKKGLSVSASEASMSFNPAPPALESKQEDAAESPADDRPKAPIDYTKYHQYRILAQQINACLEKLSEVSCLCLSCQFLGHNAVSTNLVDCFSLDIL